ncbi:hypothetical protein V8C86DRAFT_855991 [Haematococcus lacustris]
MRSGLEQQQQQQLLEKEQPKEQQQLLEQELQRGGKQQQQQQHEDLEEGEEGKEGKEDEGEGVMRAAARRYPGWQVQRVLVPSLADTPTPPPPGPHAHSPQPGSLPPPPMPPCHPTHRFAGPAAASAQQLQTSSSHRLALGAPAAASPPGHGSAAPAPEKRTIAWSAHTTAGLVAGSLQLGEDEKCLLVAPGESARMFAGGGARSRDRDLSDCENKWQAAGLWTPAPAAALAFKLRCIYPSIASSLPADMHHFCKSMTEAAHRFSTWRHTEGTEGLLAARQMVVGAAADI